MTHITMATTVMQNYQNSSTKAKRSEDPEVTKFGSQEEKLF